MQAAIRTGFLGTTLSFTKKYEKPVFLPEGIHKSDVLVEVEAAGINPVDFKTPRAMAGAIYGIDFCGKITAVGSEVKDFSVGDEVFGATSQGSLADFTIASSSKIAKKPDELKTTECSALPVAYESTLQCLRIAGVVPPTEEGGQSKDSVLVIGASGGCGIAALQLCKAMEVPRIVAICSKKNTDFVKENGATEVVDYTDSAQLEDFYASNKDKFDCVFDVATGSGGGEDYWEKSIPLLKVEKDSGGKEKLLGNYVALNGPPGKWIRLFMNKQIPNQSLHYCEHSTADLEQVASLLVKVGKTPPLQAFTFSEEGVTEAYTLSKSRRAKGKIVVEMKA